jgi:hypothetical protein
VEIECKIEPFREREDSAFFWICAVAFFRVFRKYIQELMA